MTFVCAWRGVRGADAGVGERPGVDGGEGSWGGRGGRRRKEEETMSRHIRFEDQVGAGTGHDFVTGLVRETVLSHRFRFCHTFRRAQNHQFSLGICGFRVLNIFVTDERRGISFIHIRWINSIVRFCHKCVVAFVTNRFRL